MFAKTATLKIADASTLAAIIFDEPEAALAAARLDDDGLHAPQVILAELASVAVKKIRREGKSVAATLERLATWPDYAVTLHPVDPVAAAALAAATGLSAYDASYLWLARSLDAPLVTLDAKLARAAAA